ncbi:MAG: ribosome assembly factor SBDS, partial [Nanoarchaeota archaeon]|nr:ribosome assembly factor SBDS [Nanoarchaeota archaeon]
LAIKFEAIELYCKIPAAEAAKSYSIINNFGKKLQEDWLSDGSLAVVIKMPAGMEEEFHHKMNALCHGEVETKILKRSDINE